MAPGGEEGIPACLVGEEVEGVFVSGGGVSFGIYAAGDSSSAGGKLGWEGGKVDGIGVVLPGGSPLIICR